MLWLFILLGAGIMVYFFLAPRRFQTIENQPAIVDENLHVHGVIETTEDPREVFPIAQQAQKRAGDIPAPGHGDSLTKDWPSDHREPHNQPNQNQGPANPQ